jgi:hypothetical protein
MRRIHEHLYRLDYNALKITCNEYFDTLPFPIVDFSNRKFFFGQQEWGGTNVIYRARPITNSDNRPHNKISEISYIPDDELHKIKKFGRANKPGESMFYGALNYATACTESVCKGNVFEHDDSIMLTVGVWKFETPLKLVQLPLSEHFFAAFYKMVNFKSEKINIAEIQSINQKLKNEVGNNIDFEKLMFFADCFAKWNIKNDYEYMLSNYFVDRVLNRIPEFPLEEDIDGIIYPSVALSYQEKNIVLKPEVVKNKLRFLDAMQVWFINNSKTGGGAQFIPIDQRVKVDSKGTIQWNLSK